MAHNYSYAWRIPYSIRILLYLYWIRVTLSCDFVVWLCRVTLSFHYSPAAGRRLVILSSSDSSFFLLKVIIEFCRHSIYYSSAYPYPTTLLDPLIYYILYYSIINKYPHDRQGNTRVSHNCADMGVSNSSIYAKNYQHSSCRVRLSGMVPTDAW